MPLDGSPAVAVGAEAPAPTWHVTEHPGASLPTDQDSLMQREIYPGYTLGELGYSDEESEWALYQKPLGDAASAIEGRFAGEYSYAFFGPERTFSIGFTGAAPAGALAVLDDTGLPYSTIEDLGFTAAGYEAAVSDVGRWVTDSMTRNGSFPEALFSVGSDLTSQPGAIVVSITGASSSVRRAAMDALGSVPVDAPFSVTVVEGGGNTSF
ncbi:hypothetical protein [Cryobacterium sp. PAMC25264]|uniref:hypothetical protein n=1 Tax=Cryobacterium sp. PAMC25264 TaxID=2861288 RepID=UPI001C62D78E|nr:hypothetical protein [Cryobacterium sp. PAMC25264]QYF74669.1 hypothetical protein KY500_05710 [Cryobacterium sp. PAMC25264]